MAGRNGRAIALAGPASVVALGAATALAIVLVAGGDAALGWVALAGGAACASGLALGSTAKPLPAVVLGALAAGALALAAVAASDETVEGRPSAAAEEPKAAQLGDDRPEDRAAARDHGAVAGERAARPPTPARFVRSYYAAIEAGRFKRAWASLSPVIQAQTPGFEAWRAGYATTLTQRVENVRLEPEGFVRHDLVAVDRTPCGTTTERRFEVLWKLVPSERDFTPTFLEAVQLAGIDPQLACDTPEAK